PPRAVSLPGAHRSSSSVSGAPPTMAAIGRIAPPRTRPIAFLAATVAFAAGTYLVGPLLGKHPTASLPQSHVVAPASANEQVMIAPPGAAANPGQSTGPGTRGQINHAIETWAANLARNPT